MKKGNGKDNDFFDASNKAMDELCQVNFDMLREMIEIELNYSNLWHDYLVAQKERLNTGKDITESGLILEYSNKFAETNRHLYKVVSKSIEKQMKCFNFSSVTPENIFPLLQGYENLLNTPKKKKSIQAVST